MSVPDMRVLWLLLLATSNTAGCGALPRGQPGQAPLELYERLSAAGHYSDVSPPARASTHLRVVVMPFRDATVAPTGLLLSDDEEGLIREVYYVQRLVERLEGLVVEGLQAAGVEVVRAYAPSDLAAGQGRGIRPDLILDVQVDHVELHRWMKREPWPEVPFADIDLVRLAYACRWQKPDGRQAREVDASHELILPAEEQDDLLVMAQLMVRTMLESAP